jgi:Transcriptional regulatory protein, C terminal
LQLPVGEIQLWSKQWELFFDPMELVPPDRAMPTPTAQHFAPVTLYGLMDPQQCRKIPGNTVVCIVATEHLIEMIRLLLERQMPHPPHLVLQPHVDLGTGVREEREYLRVLVNQLRKKIEDDPAHPVYVLTDSYVGYRFRDE